MWEVCFDKTIKTWFRFFIMSQDPQLNFLAGLEEAFARFLSAIFTTLLFVVFALGNPQSGSSLTSTEIIIYLGLFWIVYESLSYLFFFMFNFFARRGQSQNTENDQIKDNVLNPNKVDSLEKEVNTAKK
jgi:hypothetical protein